MSYSTITMYTGVCFYFLYNTTFIISPAKAVAVVMSASVCLCVSLSLCLCVRQDISGTARAIFTSFFVHVPYVHGSDLLQHVYDRPH